jgi:hypothetical protein
VDTLPPRTTVGDLILDAALGAIRAFDAAFYPRAFTERKGKGRRSVRVAVFRLDRVKGSG